MDPVDRTIEAAAGYLALGMPEDAWAELNSLPDAEQHTPQTLQLRLQTRIFQEDWDAGLAVGRELQERAPKIPAAYILTAYCLRELDRVEEARETLIDGPESLRDEPVFYYNLACYESLLGGIDASVAWLRRAFELDENMEREARNDPDLDNVRAELGDDFGEEFV